MILRSQPVSSLIRTGLGRFEEAEYLPKRKISFILTDFPMRYSRSLSISDLSSRMESLSGSPKRTRLQALESEILDDTLGPLVERVAAALVGALDAASAKEVVGDGVTIECVSRDIKCLYWLLAHPTSPHLL